MARKSLAEKRADAKAELEAAKRRLAKLETDAAERIGRLAIKSGLVDLELSDDQLLQEFGSIAGRFQGKTVEAGASKGASA